MSWVIPDKLPSLKGAKYISLDIETYDPDLKSKGPGVRTNGYIIGIAVSTSSNRSWYLPFHHKRGPQFTEKDILEWARSELTRHGQPKIGANLLYDLDYLYDWGVHVCGPFYDVQIAEPLLDENARSYSLDTLGEKYFGKGKEETLIEQYAEEHGWKGKAQEHLYEMPPSVVGPYAEEDTRLALNIFNEQKLKLKEEGLVSLFQMECGLIPMLLAMRQRGVRVDIPEVEKVKERIGFDIEDLHKSFAYFNEGTPLNINASREVGKVLDNLGIPYPLTEKSKDPSITQSWLKKQDHPFCIDLLECRKLQKFHTTFLQNSILDSSINGRIHCTFNQLRSDSYGTVTGRFSASNPNLQQIPSRDPELGPLCRGFFLPDEGELWGRLDYSQIELRMLAHYATGEGAETIRETYNEDPEADFHKLTATQAGVGRDLAKTINFGIVYGMGNVKLGKSLGMDINDATEFLNNYNKMMPFLKNTSQMMMSATNKGFIRTYLKRRRRFSRWEPQDYELSKALGSCLTREEAYNLVQKYKKEHPDKLVKSGVKRAGIFRALNSVIQGSCADLLKKAMLDTWNSGVCDVLGPPLLTVHDELDWSVPNKKEGHEAFKEVKYIMENALNLRVPILTDTALGKNWGECK